MTWAQKVLYATSWLLAVAGSLVLVAVVFATHSGLLRW